MPHPPGRPSSDVVTADEQFTEFVQASWASLYRTAYLLIGDHAEAEDLVQSALAKTYATWSRIRDLNAAIGYARTTMVHTASSWFRRRSWRNERPTDGLPEVALDHDLTDRSLLMQALAQLPPRQRAALVLRYYEDLTVAQTAAVLGCSEGTVKSQTSDALARLRMLLGDAAVPTTEGVRHD